MKPMSRFRNRDLTLLLILFGIALGVRLVAVRQNYLIAEDGILYIDMARALAAGQYDPELFGRYAYYAFFPLLIVPFHKLLGEWVLAGQMISTICGALTVIPLYLLGRQMFEEKIAFLGALFYIVCPNLVRYSAEVLRDIPHILFFTTALWLGYKGIKDNKLILIGLAGVSIALSAFLRIEGLTLLAALPLFLVWQRAKSHISWRRCAAACGVLFSVVACIVILGGLVLARERIQISERQVVKAKGCLLSLEYSTAERLEQEIERKGLSRRAENFFDIAIKHRFVLYLYQIYYKTVKVFNILFLLFLVGLITRKTISYRRDEFLLFAVYITLVPVFMLYLNLTNYLSTRYPFPLVVPSLIWSGVGFVELRERIGLWMKKTDCHLKEHARRWLTPLLLVIICVPLLLMAWAPHRKEKLELKEVGLWLKEHRYHNSVIVGQREFSRLAFYADAKFVEVPKRPYDDIITFARKNGANLLIINQNTINHFSPRFLRGPSPNDLERIDIPGIKTPHYATTVFLVKR